MNLLTTLSIIFLSLFSYKIISNLWYWWQLASYERTYTKFFHIGAKMNSQKDSKAALPKEDKRILMNIYENKPRIIALFKKAGLKSHDVVEMQHAGHNMLTPLSANIFENMDFIGTIGNTNVPGFIKKKFIEGIGVYKGRVKEAFSLLWWIDLLIFLPEKVISSYLGISIENNKAEIIVKTLNMVYWFIDIIIVALVFFHYGYTTIGHFNISIS